MMVTRKCPQLGRFNPVMPDDPLIVASSPAGLVAVLT
jgi:hypothetical protein